MIDTANIRTFILRNIKGITEQQADDVIEYAKQWLNGAIGKDCFDYSKNIFEKTFYADRLSMRINSFYLPVVQNLGSGYEIIGGRVYFPNIGTYTVRFSYGVQNVEELQAVFNSMAVIVARKVRDDSLGIKSKANAVDFGSLTTSYEELDADTRKTIAENRFSIELGALQ